MSTEPSPRALLVGSSSTALRRRLGPTAWMVLEEIALRSTVIGERRVARVSIRTLAGSLGIAKDTAARAVRSLRAAGVVTGAQQRTAGGVFDTGIYTITVDPEILTVKPSSASPSSARPRPSEAPSRVSQLPLELEA
jgi:DNA-binding transcriptional MocR family regulator